MTHDDARGEMLAEIHACHARVQELVAQLDPDAPRLEDLATALATTRRDFETALAAVVSGQRPLADGVDELRESQQALRAQHVRLHETVEAAASEATARLQALEDERDADRRRVEGLVRATLACEQSRLDARLDDARRDVAALETRLRVVEAAMEDARRSRARMSWWGAAEARWVQVSAFVATPIIDFREAVWQLARAASSAAKFW